MLVCTNVPFTSKLLTIVIASLVSGPLAETSAFQAKVATSPQEENPNYQHVICVYMPDVYDKDAVTKVGVVISSFNRNVLKSLGYASSPPKPWVELVRRQV